MEPWKCWSKLFMGWFLYDLSFLWAPLAEGEVLGEVVLCGGLGEHSAGLGRPPVEG